MRQRFKQWQFQHIILAFVCYYATITLQDEINATAASSSTACQLLDDHSCYCFRPNALRCQLNSSSHLEQLLQKLQNVSLQNQDEISILDLTVDRLRKVPAGIFGNFSLSVLLLSSASRSLSTVEDGAFSLGNKLVDSLVALKLPGNGFENFPLEISKLTNLQSLDVSDNSIGRLGNSVLKPLVVLESLNLGQNLLTSLNAIAFPQSLKNLNVQNNQITFNGTGRLNLGSRLMSLDLSNNKLNGNFTSTSLVKRPLRSLKTLDLSFNGLTKLKARAFSPFPALTKLNLRSNFLEIISEMAFDGLNDLTWLDLSHNHILELFGSTFEMLTKLLHLDLSYNNLQVLDGKLTKELNVLFHLDLRNNNIFKVDDGFMETCSTCTTLLLTENPLDCTCQLNRFQVWLQKKKDLDTLSRQSAVCATPPSINNAILADLPALACDTNNSRSNNVTKNKDEDEEYKDDEEYVEEAGDEEIEKDFGVQTFQQTSSSSFTVVLADQSFQAGLVNLTWEVRLNEFDCENLQVFSEDSFGNQIEVYSRPENCSVRHSSPHGVDSLQTLLDLSKIETTQHSSNSSVGEDSTSLLVCLVLKRRDSFFDESPVVSGCGSVRPPLNTDKNTSGDQSLQVISGLRARLNKTTHDLFVKFSVQMGNIDLDLCFLILELRDSSEPDEPVLSHHRLPCSASEFHFRQLTYLTPNTDFYEICLSVEVTDDIVLTPMTKHRKCVNVETLTSSTDQIMSTKVVETHRHHAPILPLFLTLVCLFIGIALLVIVYVLLRGYLNEHHRPGFLPHQNSFLSGCKVLGSLFYAINCSKFSWQRRRRRHANSRRAMDNDVEEELSLQDNLTVTSLMSE